MKWYFGALKKYATFSGRASRKEFWLFTLFNVLAYLIITFLGFYFFGTYSSSVIGFQSPLGLLYWLGTLLPAISVQVRRLHDTNHSGGWVWLSLLPLVGPIIVFVWLVSRGTEGDNEYGPDPLAVTALDAGPRPQAVLNPSTEAPTTKVVRQGSMADELKKLSELKDSGILTEAEFEEQKAKLLESD